jgi:hypothetical protein
MTNGDYDELIEYIYDYDEYKKEVESRRQKAIRDKKKRRGLRLNRDYSGGYSRGPLLVEPLPPGTLPIYNIDWQSYIESIMNKGDE